MVVGNWIQGKLSNFFFKAVRIADVIGNEPCKGSKSLHMYLKKIISSKCRRNSKSETWFHITSHS